MPVTNWRIATVLSVKNETKTARTIVLDVPDWPGHLAGQHVDVRLTAPDGYRTQRSYSLASARDSVELTVQRVEDGEVSSYLFDVLQEGFPLELRGPIGGWFVWRPQLTQPVTLIAGGSGVVPLMSMIRTRRLVKSRVPFRLLYGARSPDDVLFSREVAGQPGLDVSYVYSRAGDNPRRIGVAEVNSWAWPADFQPLNFVCGPTGFVETVADILVALGHEASQIRTERFG
jgi:ferredoxin-NADP reductase